MELTDIATLALNHMNEIQIERNLKQFISKRLQDIQENRTSHIKFSDPSFIMHLIPQSFLEGKSITINLSGIESKINQLQPLSCRGYNYRYNYEGFQTFTEHSTYFSYTQLSRKGWIEVVDTYYFSINDKKIKANLLERHLNEKLKDYICFLRNNNISEPIIIYINFIGIKGFSPYLPNTIWIDQYPIETDIITLPKVVIEETIDNMVEYLKPALDVLWNATGLVGSPNFKDGKWQPSN